jgi:hypothetical protein
MPFDFFHGLNIHFFIRGRRTWSIAIAVVMAIIVGGTFGAWYWRSIVKQRLPDWTWSRTGPRPLFVSRAGLVPDRVPESELQPGVEPSFIGPRADLTAVNKGPGASNQLYVQDFLSRDDKLSADDDKGGSYYTDLTPGTIGYTPGDFRAGHRGQFDYTQTVHVPLAGKPPGVYYLILVIDPLNTIAETDEGNNAVALKFEICPGTQCP